MTPAGLIAALRADDRELRAASPVIGIVLMVAITVILAATLGAFALGIGNQVSTVAPTASFSFELSNGGQNVTIAHEGGEAIDAGRLSVFASVAYDAEGVSGATNATWASISGSGVSITAGQTVELTTNGSTTWRGERIDLVWKASTDDSSAIVATYEP